MTDQPHAELRALLAAASTEGPWEHQCLGSEGCMVHIPGGTIRTRRPHVARFGHGEWKRDHANAEFTAAAHEMLPGLLADNARLRAENAGLRELHDVAIDACTKAAAQRDTARAELEQARAEPVRPSDEHSAIYMDGDRQVWSEYKTVPESDAVLPLVWAAEKVSSREDLADEGVELRIVGWIK